MSIEKPEREAIYLQVPAAMKRELEMLSNRTGESLASLIRFAIRESLINVK